MQSLGHAVRDPGTHTIFALATEPQRPAAVEVGCMLTIVLYLRVLRAIVCERQQDGQQLGRWQQQQCPRWLWLALKPPTASMHRRACCCVARSMGN